MAGEQLVVRIALPQLLGQRGRLPVRRRHHHQLEHVLDVPAALAELDCQPVEQLRMTGPSALRAEIFERLDESLAEQQLPEPVDEYAGDQRVVGGSQPLGEIEPRGPILDFELVQNTRRARRDNLPGVVQPVAARQHPNGPRWNRQRNQITFYGSTPGS